MQKFVNELLQQWNLSPYVWNFLLLGASILFGVILSFVFSIFVRRKTGKETHFRLGYSLVENLATPVSILLSLFFLDNLIALMQLSNDIRYRVGKANEIALIIAFAWLLIRCIKVGQDIVHYKINIKSSDNLRQRQILTQLIYIRRVLSIVIIIVSIGAVLLSFDTMRKIGTGLLTSVGIGGIIVGFAAQKSLANLLAGFQIAFTQPVRIDDEVFVENEFGRIEELTLTYVVVRVWDSRRLILPINYFLDKPFQNWTRTSAEILGTVFVYTDYSIPVDWVREQFQEIVQAHPLWDGRVVGLAVTDLKKDVMELRGLLSASTSGHAFDLRCYVREELMKRIMGKYPHSLPMARATILPEINAGAAGVGPTDGSAA